MFEITYGEKVFHDFRDIPIHFLLFESIKIT